MKTTIIAFVWRGEEGLVRPQLEHLYKVFPAACIHLVDDSSDPLPPALQEYLLAEPRVRYSQSDFARHKTLNGGDCVLGELACMRRACALDHNTDGVLIKLDLDTLVLRPATIIEGFEAGNRWVAHTSEMGLFAGMFYAMKIDVLQAISRQAEQIIWNDDPKQVPEDCAIGALCYLECLRSKYWHINLKEGGNSAHIGAFDVQSQGDETKYKEAITRAAKAMIVTVGNTGIHGLPSQFRVRFLLDILALFNASNQEIKDEELVSKA